MARLVSKVYGEALFSFAKENGQLEKMYEEALDIIEVFTVNNDVNDFLSSPDLSIAQKISFLNNLFVDKLWSGPIAKIFKFFHIDIDKGKNSKIIEFLAIIIEKGHVKDVASIFKHFTHLVLQDRNVGEAMVISANELNDRQKKELEETLVDSTDYDHFIINYSIDKSLIAGLKVKIDDKVLDTSYKTKLDNISKNLRGLKL